MAFVNSSLSAVRFNTAIRSAKVSAVCGSARLSNATFSPQKVQRASVIRMGSSDGVPAPPSTVLGLGKDVPSSLYLFLSVFAFILGCYSVYKSNIFQPLSAETVNPQFIVGSLLVPISWGL